MKHLLILSMLMLTPVSASAQYYDDEYVTGGEADDTPADQEVGREYSNNRQKEKALDRNELGGPVGSNSDYVYGTRDRAYDRDDGGSGGDYSRDDHYSDDGY